MRRVVWILLAVIAGVAGLVGLSWLQRQAEAPADVVVVDVTISRYRFDPGSDGWLNVSRGSLVELRLTSTDVTHGFAVTEYGLNVEVPPGQVVVLRFRADHAGVFPIYCTVFCGTGHPEHKGTLHVA